MFKSINKDFNYYLTAHITEVCVGFFSYSQNFLGYRPKT